MVTFTGAVLLANLAAVLASTLPHAEIIDTRNPHPGLGEYLDSRHRPRWGGEAPWGSRDCESSPDDVPNTGVTRYYDFSVDSATFAPDGVSKAMYVVNNQFPGPTIEANWGDWIEVVVHNNLKEGTAVHWHGVFQQGTPWADGVPGASQCPIAPGEKLTYRFRANGYGTSWWHSHYSAQYSMGSFGPMVIHGPKHYNFDIDLGPVLLSDWYHTDYHDVVKKVIGKDPATIIGATFSDNVLINGKNSYNCSLALPGQHCKPNAGLSEFHFKTGDTHLLRIINGGSDGQLFFSIDDHQLQVVAVDFEAIQPYFTTVIALAVGQRMDILVKGTGKSSGAYFMRARNSQGPGCDEGAHPPPTTSALAIVSYQAAPKNAIPKSDPAAFLDTCSDAPIASTVPFRVEPVNTKDIHLVNIEITALPNATGFLKWDENNSSFTTDFSDPVLGDAARGKTKFATTLNVYDTDNAKTVRFVIVNNSPATHPMHMHGHTFQVLANVNSTVWDGTITNPSNPLRRDTQVVGPMSTIVLQIESTNAGVWPIHCHIAWHVSAGLYVQFIQQRDSIQKLGVQSQIGSTCKAWDNWTKTHAVMQIDSGLRRMTVRSGEE